MDVAHPKILFELTMNTVRRNLAVQYKSTFMGLSWMILSPLILLLIYTFIFTQVFSTRWGNVDSSVYFALNLFTGMLLHGWMSESLQRSTGLLVNEAPLVKKLNFPIPVLTVSMVLTTGVQALFGLFILLLSVGILLQQLPLTVLFLPVIILPFLILLLGLCLFVSSLSVYFRDLTILSGFLSMGLLFLSPVFYPVEALPAALQSYIYLNPLTYPMVSSRELIFSGVLPEPGGLVLYYFLGGTTFLTAYWVYLKLKKGFADVL